MTKLPTASERTRAALAGAKTKAAPFAEADKWEMAYKVLLRGVGSAQRVNRAGQASTVLAGLWSVPGVKPAVLVGAAAIAGVVRRSKAKSRSEPESKVKPKPKKPKSKRLTSKKAESQSTLVPSAPQPADAPTTDAQAQPRNRFRRRPRPASVATGSATAGLDSSVSTS